MWRLSSDCISILIHDVGHFCFHLPDIFFDIVSVLLVSEKTVSVLELQFSSVNDLAHNIIQHLYFQ